MIAVPEIIEKPLSKAELVARFGELCADPALANVPGKIELDVWGRMLMSPASNLDGVAQGELVHRLRPLGGRAIPEASVLTSIGVLVADVAWASPAFMTAHATETPFTVAPEICIEIASPSNSIKELREKVSAYLDADAQEAWIVYPQSKRIEFFGKAGALAATAFVLDLAGLFD